MPENFTHVFLMTTADMLSFTDNKCISSQNPSASESISIYYPNPDYDQMTKFQACQ